MGGAIHDASGLAAPARVYTAHGWRRDCNGTWNPPDRSPGDGWRLASDGVWHPPKGWWQASDAKWYPPNGSPGVVDRVWPPPETPAQPAPVTPAWHPDPHDPEQYRYWDGSAWTEHTAPRYTNPPLSIRRTRWGSVSLWCALSGGLLIIVGFVGAIGTRPPDPGEEDTFALVIGGMVAAMLSGFLLQVVALAVGLIGSWRLDWNERDERLNIALWISIPVVAVGMAVIPALVAFNL